VSSACLSAVTICIVTTKYVLRAGSNGKLDEAWLSVYTCRLLIKSLSAAVWPQFAAFVREKVHCLFTAAKSSTILNVK